jgi:hypothetical protein
VIYIGLQRVSYQLPPFNVVCIGPAVANGKWLCHGCNSALRTTHSPAPASATRGRPGTVAMPCPRFSPRVAVWGLLGAVGVVSRGAVGGRSGRHSDTLPSPVQCRGRNAGMLECWNAGILKDCHPAAQDFSFPEYRGDPPPKPPKHSVLSLGYRRFWQTSWGNFSASHPEPQNPRFTQ